MISKNGGNTKRAYSPFIRYLAQSIRQADAERGLHDSRRKGDAPDSPERSNEVYCRGGHCVVCSWSATLFCIEVVPSSFHLPECSKEANDVNKVPGLTIPWPSVAGKMYTQYFHASSSKPNATTSRLPRVMSTIPPRTSSIRSPRRDMTRPAIKPPMGPAAAGTTRRSPAVVAVSRRTDWKKRGRVKRNCPESA